MTLITLQHYWWIIVSLLGSLLVFLMFVQGGQTLIYTLGKTETERKMIVNALGRKWEFTFTTLVTFGGAFFASFPLFYSTSFGGAYWVWMAILLAFVIQAVAYEFRSKPNNFFGHKTYEAFLIINGALGTILIGAAVSTFFTGSAFSVDKMNLTNLLSPTISRWQGPAHGLEAVLNWRNVALGLTIFFLARLLGTMYILNTVDDENIRTRGKKQILINAIPFLVFFLAWTGALLLAPGFAVNPDTGEVFMQPYKYWLNLIEMPVVLILLGIGVLFVVLGLLRCYFWFNKCYSRAIWPTSIGTVLTVFSVFLLAGFNNTAYYPSTYDLQNSLTLANSSSSKYTLVAMSYVSLLVPFVLAYIWYAWWSINRKQITVAEMSEDTHAY